MSSQKFRARAINASKQIPIYSGDEVPDLSECSTTPDMAAVFIGMEKEEQYEHHLLAKIFEGRVIPVPDVTKLEGDDYDEYNKMYSTNFIPPKQLIRMDPFGLDQEDVSNYDADDEDEIWINTQAKDLGITLNKFESIIDKLESMSQYSIVTLAEAKVSLDENQELLTCIYDYWQSKRLKLQQPLIPTVPSTCSTNSKNANPYVAFRRPFLNMQTRRNKKNDEKFYMRVLKIKKDLDGLLELIELVRKREMAKKDLAEITLKIFEKRFAAEDWTGEWINEVTNDQLAKPVSSTEVPAKVNNEEGPFTFVRREDCTYLPPKSLNVRPQSPTLVFNGIYGRGNRFSLHQSYMYDDESFASNFKNFDASSFHHPGSIYQGNGMQMIRPAMPFMYYLPPDDEDKKLNAYRFNDKELVLCSESNKADVENVFQEGLLNSTEDNANFSQSPDDLSEDIEMFDCEDMYASMEICDLFDNPTDELFNSDHDFLREHERDEDTVGCSSFKI